jgi:hypothetical protein
MIFVSLKLKKFFDNIIDFIRKQTFTFETQPGVFVYVLIFNVLICVVFYVTCITVFERIKICYYHYK